MYASCILFSFIFQFHFGVFVSFLFVLQLAIVICMLGAAGSIESYTSCPASAAEGYVWAVSTTRQAATVTIARRASIGTATNTSQIAGLAKVYAPCLCHWSPSPLFKTKKIERKKETSSLISQTHHLCSFWCLPVWHCCRRCCRRCVCTSSL